MIEKQETKTIISYISEDGKEFESKSSCEYHERELAKSKLKKRIGNLTLEELNAEIIKFTNKLEKQYTTNIEDALELEKEVDLFYKLDYYLFRDKDDDWCIEEKEYDGCTSSVAFGKTISEVICRAVIQIFYKLR